MVHVYFEGDNITTFRFAEAWPKARFRSWRHLMDEVCRLPEVEPARKPAVFQTVKSSDGLTWAKPFWYKYFGNSLAAELETILDGHFCIAKDGLPLRPIFMRNHPSLEDDPLAQEVLFRVLAAWLDAGSLEYVERWHRLPHCILACGSVPKNTEPYRRLITDARPINVYAQRWRVKYVTVRDLCLLLGYGFLMWIRDLKNAYHLTQLMGCHRGLTRYVRWVTKEDGSVYEPRPAYRMGCDPGSCLGMCDKSMFGICVAGHVCRFAVCQFCGKVSGGPLHVLTDHVCLFAIRRLEVLSKAFVDDFVQLLGHALSWALRRAGE